MRGEGGSIATQQGKENKIKGGGIDPRSYSNSLFPPALRGGKKEQKRTDKKKKGGTSIITFPVPIKQAEERIWGKKRKVTR